MKLFLLVLIVTVLSVAAAAETLPPRRVRSIVQACRKEVRTLCPGGSMKDINKCLQEKIGQVTDTTCQKWIKWSAQCDEAIAGNAKCSPKDNSRMCLRKVPKAELPDSCTQNEYYASIRMGSKRFVRPNSPPVVPKTE